MLLANKKSVYSDKGGVHVSDLANLRKNHKFLIKNEVPNYLVENDTSRPAFFKVNKGVEVT